MEAFLAAWQFLTVFSRPGAPDSAPHLARASVVSRFPLVGFSLGLILVVLDGIVGMILPGSALDAVLVVTLAAFAGGIPLSGLACLSEGDGRDVRREAGSGGNGEGVLGPMGVLLLAAVLLSKYGAFRALPDVGRWTAFLVAPTLGRASMAYLLASVPPAWSEEESGPGIMEGASPADGYVALGWGAAVSLLFGFLWGLLTAVLAGVLTLCLGRYLERRPEKTSREFAGAGEVIETAAFLIFAAIWGR